MENINEKPHITPAKFGRMTLSSLVDLLLFIGLAVGIYFALGKPVFLDQGPYQTALKGRYEYIRDSALVEEQGSQTFAYYVYKDTTETTPEDYAYKKYINVIWNYMTVVVPTHGDYSSNLSVRSSREGNPTIPAYGQEVSALDQAYGRYIYENYFGYKDEGSSFVPSIADDFTSKPVAGKDEAEYHAALANEFYLQSNNAIKGYYVDAVAHLTAQPTLLGHANTLNYYSYLSMLPSYVAPAIIVFFLVPLCVPGCRSVGKLLFGTMVLDVEGYPAPKAHLIFRQAIITTIPLMLAIPIGGIGMPLALLLAAVGFVTRTVSKTGQALHDRLTHTLIVEKAKTIPYESKEQRDQLMNAPIEEEAEEAVINAEDATLAQYEKEQSILDLSTINARREEARKMTSFDEFEKENDAKVAQISKEEPVEEATEEEELSDEDKETLKDLVALEGLSEEEAKELLEQEKEREKEGDPNDDDFVDGAGDK